MKKILFSTALLLSFNVFSGGFNIIDKTNIKATIRIEKKVGFFYINSGMGGSGYIDTYGASHPKDIKFILTTEQGNRFKYYIKKNEYYHFRITHEGVYVSAIENVGVDGNAEGPENFIPFNRD